jgi:hypothetical protein
MPPTEGGYLFAAAGDNEAAVWGIPEAGESFKCFRTVPLDASRGPLAPLPILVDVELPRHPHAPIRSAVTASSFALAQLNVIPAADSLSVRTLALNEALGNVGTTHRGYNHSVRALLGRISQSNLSYLITAGTDRCIRYWDLSSASKCFTVCGLQPAQPKGIFDCTNRIIGQSTTGSETVNTPLNSSKLFVCYVAETPSADKILQAHLPVREGRGVTLPSNNFKVLGFFCG